MTTIVEGIHEANPDAHIVGFGYDTMFGGVGCEAIARGIIPQCWEKEHNSSYSSIRCFQTQQLRIQEAWTALAQKYPYVTAVDLLGATQAAGGDKGVTVGHPNLDKFGPAHYWPLTLECYHPGTAGGEKRWVKN